MTNTFFDDLNNLTKGNFYKDVKSGTIIQIIQFWSQEGLRGDEYFDVDIYSKEGKKEGKTHIYLNKLHSLERLFDFELSEFKIRMKNYSEHLKDTSSQSLPKCTENYFAGKRDSHLPYGMNNLRD